MTCFHPLKGFKVGTLASGKDDIRVCSYDTDYVVVNRDGTVEKCKGEIFRRPLEHVITDFIELPCGKCIGCRLKHSREWADRCVLEAKQYKHNYFVTLTYDDEHLPMSSWSNYETGEVGESATLCMRDVQLFFKRLRKRGFNFRYFYCGEYGSNTFRPHYHVIFFNLDLPDLEFYKNSTQNFPYYNSKLLNVVWGKGYCVISNLTWETCAYTARYCMKKSNNNLDEFYKKYNLVPEYVQMSRNPGIARDYFEKNLCSIYACDELFVNTSKGSQIRKPPRYFDKIFEQDFPENFNVIKGMRQEVAQSIKALKLEQTDLSYLDMLGVEEEDLKQRIKVLKRDDI